ncbi:hypothetical protein JHK87_049547 [Glycine soja]|nr:hypothetical protein JHK87_049547 [Glycine soja]
MATGLRGRSYGHCSSLPPPSSRGDVEEARSPVTAVLVVAAEEVPVVTRALLFGVSFRPVVFVAKVTSGTTSNTSSQHENLMTMYNKVLRAEFEFPPCWRNKRPLQLRRKKTIPRCLSSSTRLSLFRPCLLGSTSRDVREQEEDSSGVHIKVLHGGDCGEDCGGDVGAEVPCGGGQGLQDLTAGCGRGEEEEADGHGGGVRGGTRGHFRDKDNRRRGLLIRPFFNWVESPHEHSHFQPVVDNTINAFHCLIESTHKDHPDLQSQTRHHPKSNPNPFSILLFTKIYNPNPSRSLSFSACTTTLTPPTSSQFSQWKAWGRLLFFAHFWIVTIICEERSKGLMALVRMVRRP